MLPLFKEWSYSAISFSVLVCWGHGGLSVAVPSFNPFDYFSAGMKVCLSEFVIAAIISVF